MRKISTKSHIAERPYNRQHRERAATVRRMLATLGPQATEVLTERRCAAHSACPREGGRHRKAS